MRWRPSLSQMNHAKTNNAPHEMGERPLPWTHGDDAEILEAALAFIDSWDSSDGSDYNSAEAKTSESLRPPAIAAKQTPRHRLKDEIVLLRELANTLEKQIQEMRPRSAPRDDSDRFWQDIAQRQKNLRVTAEVENTKLREALRRQLALARRLAKTAKRGASMEVRYRGLEVSACG
jgi:hypothetical protein